MIDPIASLLGDWATGLTPASIIFRALIAILFAAVIGCERAAKRHAAGLAHLHARLARVRYGGHG